MSRSTGSAVTLTDVEFVGRCDSVQHHVFNAYLLGHLKAGNVLVVMLCRGVHGGTSSRLIEHSSCLAGHQCPWKHMQPTVVTTALQRDTPGKWMHESNA
jgi:hypothetical protein